jgi:succinate dehydrogenase hydrophobic anchor subunit
MIAESGTGLWPVRNRPAPGSILNNCMHSINWTAILLAIMVLVMLVRSGPGIRALLERSRQAEQRDWIGFLVPIALVVLFVLFLIKSVKS